jgi:hypothetical protein
VRDSTAIGQQEAEYISQHRVATQQAWTDWLTSAQGADLDTKSGIPGGVAAYTKNTSNLPRVAIALSGGGLKAMVSSSLSTCIAIH